jgi:hypothetical protein
LVRCTSDELELLNWDAEGLEYSFEEEGVVFCPVLEGLEGGFVGVEETVQLQVSPSGIWEIYISLMTYIGEKNFDLLVSSR